MSWFQFNGVDSRTMNVIVSDFPPETRAEERVRDETVPGRHGRLTKREGRSGAPVYDSVDLTMHLAAMPGADLDRVRAWLSGSGPLILGNDPTRYRTVRMTGKAEYERVVRGRPHRRLELNMSAQPFRYLVREDPIPLTSMGFVPNNGTIEAEPLITVYGSGDVALSVGAGKLLLISGMSDKIVLDGPARNAYLPDAQGNPQTLLSGIVTGDYPVLPVGTSVVSWSGAVSRVEIKVNTRWL